VKRSSKILIVIALISHIAFFEMMSATNLYGSRAIGFGRYTIVWEEDGKYYECQRGGGPRLEDRWHREISKEDAERFRAVMGDVGRLMNWGFVVMFLVFGTVMWNEISARRRRQKAAQDGSGTVSWWRGSW
jgi:hypothetical protein